MKRDPLEQRMESAERRIESLRQRVHMPPERRSTWAEAIDEFLAILRELRGAAIELDRREEELTTALQSAPIRDKWGRESGAVGILQDITEIRETRRSLRRYANLLRALHEADQAILAAWSAAEIAEAVLPHVQQLVPYLRASVTLFDTEADQVSLLAVHPDDENRSGKGLCRPLERGSFIQALEQGQIQVTTDLEILPEPIRSWGSEGALAYLGVPLGTQGDLIGSLNLSMDSPRTLTAEELDVVREVADQLAIGIRQAQLYERLQRRADELEERVTRRTTALRASEERFRAVFEEAGIGIALVDTEARLVVSNPALQEMLGYSGSALQGMPFSEFLHPDGKADVDLYGQLLCGERNHYKMEKRFVRKDGQMGWCNLIVTLTQRTQHPLVIVMMEDITEQKEAQEALIQAEKLAVMGRQAASLAHEISNPLQSVMGCLGLAEEVLAEGGSVSRYLEIAIEELDRTAGIVGRLRDLHRRSQPEDRKLADVNVLVEQVLALNEKRCQDHGVEVVWQARTDLPLLLLVPDRIQQVFLNLTLNAVEAMPEGGQLQVTTARTSHPKGVRITFADSGVGIPSDDLPHLFKPFHSTKEEGLGLGLYVSRNVVEDHGGHIEAESKVDEGTAFTVWLPCKDEPPRECLDAGSAGRLPGVRGEENERCPK